MAKRKKKANADVAVGMSPSSSNSGRLSTDITDAENGFIVNVSGETGGKKPSYFSKRYVASDRNEALRIASSCLAGSTKAKGGKKKGGKKKIALKKG